MNRIILTIDNQRATMQIVREIIVLRLSSRLLTEGRRSTVWIHVNDTKTSQPDQSL